MRSAPFVAAVFVGAAALFVLESMFAKMLLPGLGGAPAVWNTCMVFYQAALFLAYLYAHLAGRLPPRVQVGVHLTLVLAASVMLPVAAGAGQPPADRSPIPWLILHLAARIGLPFFAAAATAPLVQRWFVGAGGEGGGGRDPYRLYVASNAGSLIGVLGYPLLEPFVGLRAQSILWTGAYGALAVLLALCGARFATAAPREIRETPAAARLPGAASTAPWTRWFLLAFAPSALLLSVTAHVSADVASAPLLWMAPLALYLVTFMIAFAGDPAPRPVRVTRALPLAVVAIAADLFLRTTGATWIVLCLHLGAFFAIAWGCHAEMARTRPPASRLTGFYLWISAGGVAGGLFSGIAAPLLFDSVLEYPLLLGLVLCLRPLPAGRMRRATLVGSAALALLLAAGVVRERYRFPPLHLERSFFGVHRVELDQTRHFTLLLHGTTVHGAQGRTEASRRVPLTYYHPTGPVGQLLLARRDELAGRRVAAIGLGAGALAAYGQPGQRWTFLEIDPVVIRIARDPRLFTYLADSAAEVRIVPGDARLTFPGADSGAFAMVILDAFSSDSIPLHLLTREAIATWLGRLADDGALAFNVSNRWMDVEPALGEAAASLGLRAWARRETTLSKADQATRKMASHWVVMARRPEALGTLLGDRRWRPARRTPGRPPLSDDLVSALPMLRW